MDGNILRPTQTSEIAELIAWAVSENQPLEVMGAGTKRDIGQASNSEYVLDVSAMTGIMLYEPEELILQAHAGTPVADIEKALKKHNQELAFEPADYSALLGVKKAKPTIGGILAGNISGPRRIKAGAARDHFLGVNAVSGRGEIFKSGGRVVKNVTGYDMCKIMAGSWGTLGVMSDVVIKVLPAPSGQASIVVLGLNNEQAIAAMAQAMKSDCEVTGAAHLPLDIAKKSNISEIVDLKKPATIFRLEGVGPSVTYRRDRLIAVLKTFGKCEVLKAAISRNLWREISDVTYFAEPVARCVWRVSSTPSEGAKLVAALKKYGAVSAYFDWAGGLIWLSLAAKDDALAGPLRELLGHHGGHATLIRASAALRAAIPVFQPHNPGVRLLSERLKRGFDPSGILNPGRMYAGV